ncbi:M96 mating-specific protein family [Phytophthora palmivora]|uniref:M96 mating-specific protein family n=1 Tax=Phytophthora palmivora TaxID=4796 RepID=A0A2P4YCY2_9STRA|nr:M96 mating-specific protein family [Phytophthora palmivora]
MSLQLVDDDQVLEAALSLLDQVDGEDGDALQQMPSKKKRRAATYNPNRAREAQRKELLALREQIPHLEKRLETLKRNVSMPPQGAIMMELWRKVALHERKTRENAEEENRRLRDLVRENAEVTTQNVQQLLQTRPESVESCSHICESRPEPWPWPYRRMYAVPIDPRDGNMLREMAESIDVVHRQVLQVYSTDSNPYVFDTTRFPTTEKTHCRVFADKILPFSVDEVGDAAWQFFAHSFRRPTTRFYYHTDSHQSGGLVSDDTVVEVFGEEHRFGQVLLDIKVKQIVRRYIAAGRVVVAWRALLSPEKFKTATLTNVVFEEKGALVIESYLRSATTMTLLFAEGSKTTELSDARLREIVHETLQKLETQRGATFDKAVIVPPDFTRFHSKSGVLSQYAYEYLQDKMFGDIPKDLFRVHDWRNDVVTIGQVPAELIQEASDGKVNEPWPAQINKLLWEGGHDLVLSIGQVVPHEVMGMANYNKNIFVGTGGSEGINFSHFIGAVYGMERMMGRADNPLRRILNYASTNFLQKLPLIYIQTVIGRGENGDLVTRGVFIGDDEECFMKAAELSLEVNFELLDAPIEKVVVFLDPEEFKSTWLGNKSIYRTRMAIADDGELIVLAPGVARFGEDKRIDELIRKYGYRTTPEVLAHLNANRDLMKNLSAAAHLIHGSSEGRFRITYCPGHLTKEEVEGVGFGYGGLKEMSAKYPVDKLQDGWNVDANGERFFYISNPALGLWAYRGRFEGSTSATTSTTATAAATSLSASADTTEACLDAGVGGGPFKHT